jgi:hypothetical protein
MYLKDSASGDLVEITDINALVDPCQSEVSGRFHAGEELQDISRFNKSQLVFPSGEALPKCWRESNYRG